MTRPDAAGEHLDPADLDTSARLLSRWAIDRYGPGTTVANVAPMPGHAGLSFGLDVCVDGAEIERLVIRVAPPGLQRKGPADVLHQVPVLRAAQKHGIPVPAVRAWGEDERWFGSPYFVVERLPGSSLNAWERVEVDPATVETVFDQAVESLATLHAIDWRRCLPGWSTPRTLTDEVGFWESILRKGKNEVWTERALPLRDLLLRTAPADPEPAVVHGDFYSNNWVCSGPHLLGVVDWEISRLGPALLDLGWLAMVCDPESWGPTRRAFMGWAPEPADLADRYAKTSGRAPHDLAWYRALAAWQFSAITALNVRLHRTGRRHDPIWEEMAESFDPLVRRGCELLQTAPATAS